MSIANIEYATDEDVVLFAPSEFALLVPPDQVLAAGTDGGFDPADRWTLNSATVDFEAAGLAPGHVVRLTKPTTHFRTDGSTFAVESVSGSSVTMRRLGLPAGQGAPIGPDSGLTDVSFEVLTFGPQLDQAGRDIERWLGLDPNVPGKRPSDLADTEAIRAATLRLVLSRRYLLLARSGDRDGLYLTKAEALATELNDLLSSLTLHWKGPSGPGGQVASRPAFDTRVSR